MFIRDEEEKQVQEAIRVSIEKRQQRQINVCEESEALVIKEEKRQIEEVQEKQEPEDRLELVEQSNAYIWRFEHRKGMYSFSVSDTLPSHITVRFDQNVTDIYFGEFIKFFNSLLRKVRRCKSSIICRRSPLTITYQTTMDLAEFQALLDQANNYFRPV